MAKVVSRSVLTRSNLSPAVLSCRQNCMDQCGCCSKGQPSLGEDVTMGVLALLEQRGDCSADLAGWRGGGWRGEGGLDPPRPDEGL